MEPTEQALCGEVGEEFHSTPWSAVQYSSTGIYGAVINTTNAKEPLTTTTIETSFGDCLNVWDSDKNSSFQVEYDLAVPTAFKKYPHDPTCAVYASLSVYLKTKPGLPSHFIWYETKVHKKWTNKYGESSKH